MGMCRQCHGPLLGRPSPKALYCIDCLRARFKPDARPNKSKWSLYFTLAHRYVEAAVKYGDLRKLDGSIRCDDCGEPATCYDHRDYSRPLEVAPVCAGCNSKRYFGAMPKAKEFARMEAA